MKILITGGAGFQGSHLLEHLLPGNHHITILNTYSEIAARNISLLCKDINCVWGSITDPEIVEKTIRGQDVIVHMAARIHVGESINNPSAFIETNVKGTLNILEAMRNANSKAPSLIYWSTCEVYGAPLQGKLSECSELRPQSPYAASKAAADRLCYAYYKTYGLNITIVRPFNIFGERQKIGVGGAVIPTFVEQAMNNQPLTISGSGKQTRDYLNVKDVIRAFDIILQNKNLSGQTINFATGINTSILEIARYIAKKFNTKIIHTSPRPGEVIAFPADCHKAKSLGFRPSIPIWEGIDNYINWRLQK